MKYRHDLPVISFGVDFDHAPHEPSKPLSLFDRAPHWMVMAVTWLSILIGCAGFWAFVFRQLSNFQG